MWAIWDYDRDWLGAHIYTYLHAYIYIDNMYIDSSLCILTYIHRCACVYIIYTRTCVCVHIYIHIYIYAYVLQT